MVRQDAVLTLDGVSLRYGRRLVVEDLTLTVESGEILGLLGANGSGKSSTLAACAGLLPLAAGRIRLRGHSPDREPLVYRRQLGYVPQELALYEELTGRENLRFFGRMYGLAGHELQRRIADVLHAVRLSERADDPVGTYSGGMQRRLNLACALLHRPALLLLDEPTCDRQVLLRQGRLVAEDLATGSPNPSRLARRFLHGAPVTAAETLTGDARDP